MNYRKGLLIIPAASLFVVAAALLGIASLVDWDSVFYDIFNGYEFYFFRDNSCTVWGLAWIAVVASVAGGVAFWKADKSLPREDWFKIAHLLAILLAALIIAFSLHWKTK